MCLRAEKATDHGREGWTESGAGERSERAAVALPQLEMEEGRVPSEDT